MKKLIFVFSFFLCGLYNECAAQMKSQTSEAFELCSIVFRLAEAQEYMHCAVPKYARDIDDYFAPYAGHELIAYNKELREQYGVAYDAVMDAAACLEVGDGGVKVRPDVDIARISEVEPRWTPETYGKFVGLLDDFYRESDFHTFYASHEKLYNVATERLDEMLGQVDVGWFESFFGEALGDRVVIASLTNGGANYGLSTNEAAPVHGIVIGGSVDMKGYPRYYSYSTLPLIVHEFSHGFSYDVFEKSWDDRLVPAVEKIYSQVEERVSSSGYGAPGVMITEWFNGLCELMYLREHPIQYAEVERRTAHYQLMGFIWTERSVDLMNEFYADRETYPTIREFMPRILAFIDETAGDWDRVKEEHRDNFPRVVETIPASGSVLTGDKITIRFSRPMYGAYGIQHVKDDDVLFLPTDKEHWQDSTTFVLRVKAKKLQKGKKYGFQLHQQFFQSAATYPMIEDFDYYLYTPE